MWWHAVGGSGSLESLPPPSFSATANFYLFLTLCRNSLFDLGRYEPTAILIRRLKSHLSYLRADDDALRDAHRDGDHRSSTPFEAAKSLSDAELVQACQDRGLFVSMIDEFPVGCHFESKAEADAIGCQVDDWLGGRRDEGEAHNVDQGVLVET
jgi:hypothetical protein